MFDFTLLALPGMFASGVGITLDVLTSAAALARGSGCSPPTWRIVSTHNRVELSNGLGIDALPLPDADPLDRSIWIVPGLTLADETAIAALQDRAVFGPVLDALRSHVENGGEVAASCSGVFLLQSAGLLAGHRATTTWWLGGLLQRLAPQCKVDVDKMVIDDGPIITAGAAFAHLDLVLHLLRARFSPALAEAVSREMVIDGRQSQAAFIVPATLVHGNDLASRLVSLFEAALPHPPSVEVLAGELGMSGRTLLRHIKSATGRSASALLQSVRINRARMLLETSNLSVEEVAAQVGYADTTALRRLMRRITQATPQQFRTTVRDDRGPAVETAPALVCSAPYRLASRA